MKTNDDGVSLRDIVNTARSLELIQEDGTALSLNMELVERMAAQGMTATQISALLGVSRSDLIKRKAMAEHLQDAVERGKAIGVSKVSSTLLDQASKGNTIAAIFYLKAVAGWREADKRPPDVLDDSGAGVKIYLPEKDKDDDVD